MIMILIMIIIMIIMMNDITIIINTVEARLINSSNK